MTPQKSDVLIIGGGFMGASSAFFLRQHGRSVTLLERDQIGQYASGVNFGNVRRQGRFLGQLELSNRSWALWKRLPELIGEDLEFIPSGHMRVCYREDEIAELEAYAAAPEARELDLQILSGKALHDRFPFLGAQVKGGSYAPHDGHANPRLAAPAFARAAIRAGARIEERTEVIEVQKVGGEFQVTTADGQLFVAEQLLITAGAWGARLAEQFGESVPLEPNGPQMSVTEPIPYALPTVIGVFTRIKEEVIYFRQIPRGNIIIGGGNRNAQPPRLLQAGEPDQPDETDETPATGCREAEHHPCLERHRELHAGLAADHGPQRQGRRPVLRVWLLRPWFSAWPRRR
ncbi:FAD dependent oxidoreductase [Pseudomonas syringae pv. papulans]|nr:FAD dependent oxidoreductase [Pseudomonas syringae pv. papulans]RMN42409.1 FAD dependent oxidoreductase [Pseudomonas syringae pv. papulans]RMN57225.1 FAD dependent oxidoreductase [Pseudomonas syringae pv. papulans]